MDTYKEKYIRYKNKYLELKDQIGSGLVLCPYCDIRINSVYVVDHIRINHNITLTQEQVNKMIKDKKKQSKGPPLELPPLQLLDQEWYTDGAAAAPAAPAAESAAAPAVAAPAVAPAVRVPLDVFDKLYMDENPELYLLPPIAREARIVHARSLLPLLKLSPAFPEDTYPDVLHFDLKSIPLQLLFESPANLPAIAFEVGNLYKCVYCGLEFNRYYLAKHLLSEHSMIINLEDLYFIKTFFETYDNENENKKYMIAKIHKKILERDTLLLPIELPTLPAPEALDMDLPPPPEALDMDLPPPPEQLESMLTPDYLDDLFLTETPGDYS